MSPDLTSMLTARRRDSLEAPAEPLWFEWLAIDKAGRWQASPGLGLEGQA